MIVLDTSGLLAALDSSQRTHARATAALSSAAPPLLLSPFVLAELDYLIATRVGTAPEMALLDDVSRGAYQLEPFASGDIAEARALLDRYDGLQLGLADASLLVLCRRHGTGDILTLDERHFRAIVADWLPSRSLRLMPSDA